MLRRIITQIKDTGLDIVIDFELNSYSIDIRLFGLAFMLSNRQSWRVCTDKVFEYSKGYRTRSIEFNLRWLFIDILFTDHVTKMEEVPYF
jgi:hypothetical protein